MDFVISQIDQKYHQFLDALERKNFHGTFKNIYEYFDIVHSQKDLLKIIDADRLGIEEKKQVVNSDEKLTAKDKKEVIKRIEDQSFSFGFDKINKKIYLPMNKYKESLTLSPKESLTGRALAVKENYGNLGEYLADIFFSSVFGNTEPAKVLWTRFIYHCSINDIAIYMEKLHSGLIKKKLELPVIQFKEERPTKIRIVIDGRKGIYQVGKEQLAYGVKNDSNRMKIIDRLIAKDNCGVAELAEISGQATNVTVKSIAKINELFRESLHLTDDLILRLKTGGYSLNKDVFDISIKP